MTYVTKAIWNVVSGMTNVTKPYVMLFLHDICNEIHMECCFRHDVCGAMGNTTICPQCDQQCYYSELKDSCIYAQFNHVFDNKATVALAIFMSAWGKSWSGVLVWGKSLSGVCLGLKSWSRVLVWGLGLG